MDLPFYCDCLTRNRDPQQNKLNNAKECRGAHRSRSTPQKHQQRLYHCCWFRKNGAGSRSHRQKFFAKAASLTLSVHQMDVQNPVPFLTLVIQRSHRRMAIGMNVD
jgi:hypothetical protein